MSNAARLLIVEDDPDLLEMLQQYFRVQGYQVTTAAWGEDAVRLTEANALDLVMLDIRLPDIDGYEVCRRIRASRRTQDLPVIFLTEKRDRVDKLAGLELGVVDYITKPFDIQELRLRVRNALRRAEQAALVNPVTNTPEGALVDETLKRVLAAGKPWAALSVRIQGLGAFREMYGFVNADDVLRAVILMINNAIRESGDESDFVGHLAASDFVVLTDPERLAAIRERIELRIQKSMEYFYPLRDRERAREAMAHGHLSLSVGQITSEDAPKDLTTLKKRLLGEPDEESSLPVE
ncbi:MAG: response regulator [Anaerolineae bacterium]|nr:response regulator [Anaerolineae bacterium]